MLVLKILVIGDVANSMTRLQKVFDEVEIDIIDFESREGPKLTIDVKKKFFSSTDVRDQIEEINKIKSQYEICLVVGWSASRLAYLCGLNYIIYFVGDDIRHPPFLKNKSSKFYTNLPKNNFFERLFYMQVIRNAAYVVTGFEERFLHLNKYRKDAKRIDNIFFEFKIPEQLGKKHNKIFKFFSPSRIGLMKGFDKIFQAMPLCQSKFMVDQVDWWDSNLDLKTVEDLKKNIPNNFILIPMVDQKDIWKHYVDADCVIQGVGLDYPEFVAIESILCNRPVVSYSNPQTTFILNGEVIKSPFLPNSKEISEIAQIFDTIVDSKEFRDELLHKQIGFIKKLNDREITKKKWMELFLEYNREKSSIISNLPIFYIRVRLFLFLSGLLLKKIKIFVHL